MANSSTAADSDVFSGGKGDDRLEGGFGGDIYIFERGDGRDTIADLGGADRIAFGEGIVAGDVAVAQVDGKHIELLVADGSQRIRIEDALVRRERAIETVEFADGTSWSWDEIVAQTYLGGATDDVLTAASLDYVVNGSFEEFIVVSTHNWGHSVNEMFGWTEMNGRNFQPHWHDYRGVVGADGDYYLDMDLASANARIGQEFDNLAAGEQFELSFIHATRDSISTSGFDVFWNGTLVARVKDTGKVMVRKNFIVTAIEGTNLLEFQGTGGQNGVGSSLDDVSLHALGAARGAVLDGGMGNDILRGDSGDDTLVGGTGNDRLEGGRGDDTYLFDLGDGQDTIVDTEGANRLVFGAGIDPASVFAVPGKATLVLRIAGTEDRIDLGETASETMGIQSVEFGDGTVWSASTLVALAQAAEAGRGILAGDAGDNALVGGVDDDLLLGLGGNDDLDGGAGNDRLEGGAGNDTYRFARGGGHDRIADTGGADAIVFADDIAPGQVAVEQSRDGANFVLRIVGTSDRLTIEDALGSGQIEEVRFADGTVWTNADLIAQAGTFGDDVITGDAAANILEGGLGNDTLKGKGGADTYRFALGDGSDTIIDGSTSTGDVLEIYGHTAASMTAQRRGTDSDDLVLRFAGSTDQVVIVDGLIANRGVESVVFEDGTTLDFAALSALVVANQATDRNDVLTGTDGDDTLEGGLGNDLGSGGAGSDNYVYAQGDGDDRIEPLGGGADLLQLVDLDPQDLASIRRAGPDSDDLVLTFQVSGDRLTIAGALSNANNGGFAIHFADGTVWDREAMRAAVIADSDGAGNDAVYGFGGEDSFAARAGNDLLVGNGGANSYAFGAGSGNDRIEDRSTSAGDSVAFEGINSADVSVERLARGSETVVFRIAGNEQDSLTVVGALATDGSGIESYTFADGVTWSAQTLRDRLANRAPNAQADGTFSVVTGSELVIDAATILANDFDADGDALRIVAVDAGVNGVASLDADGNIRFTAIGGYYGPLTIGYTLSDGRNGFDTSQIEVRVRPVAKAFDDTGFTMAEDSNLVVRTERLLSNDLDGDRMVVGQVISGNGGTASLSSNGEISFTPNANFNGTASFTYVANTPEGGRAEAKVFIQVTPVNDAPVARNDGAPAVAEGGSFKIDPLVLLANDSDIDGDALQIESVQSNANVAVSIDADGLITVAPRDYYWGNAYFDYTLSDGKGGTSTGRVSFTVTPVNDAPELKNDRFETNQDGSPILEDNPIIINADQLLANDIEHDGDTMTVTGVGGAYGGSARLLDNGTVEFKPNANFNGEARFDYRVDDGEGGVSWARATIVYQPVNDRPVARDDSYKSDALKNLLRGTEDTAMTIPIIELLKNDYDIEGFALTFEEAGNAVNGDLVVTDEGTIVFTPDPDFWGEATFSYSVTDPEGEVNSGRVTLWFENVGDGPPVAAKDTIYVYEDVPTVIELDTLLANDTDIDRDPLTFLGWSNAQFPLNGKLEYDVDGNLLFTPDRDATASGGFRYTITDNADGNATGKVDIVIIPSNDDPTVGEDFGFITPLDAPLVIRVSDLLANDFDIEQVDTDGDGKSNYDIDDPRRPRPRFVGVDGVYAFDPLQTGQRVSAGEAEIVEWQGEKFVVVRFPTGFSGKIAIEYRIADAQGAEDVGFANASVADFYAGTLTGTVNPDYIEGTAGADIIKGLSRADWIVALDGDDTILADTGDDWIEAGAGDDFIDAGDGADQIFGGEGFDTVTFENSDVLVRADLASRVGQGGFAQGDVYAGIEALIGSAWNDILGGDEKDNTLEGRAGRDTIEGRGGDDTILGEEGDDTLSGGEGADLIDGGEGSDTAVYEFSAAGIAISLANGTASAARPRATS